MAAWSVIQKSYNKGDEIVGIDASEADGCTVFHAGTSAKDGHIYTNGGRVLGVVAKLMAFRRLLTRLMPELTRFPLRMLISVMILLIGHWKD